MIRNPNSIRSSWGNGGNDFDNQALGTPLLLSYRLTQVITETAVHTLAECSARERAEARSERDRERYSTLHARQAQDRARYRGRPGAGDRGTIFVLHKASLEVTYAAISHPNRSRRGWRSVRALGNSNRNIGVLTQEGAIFKRRWFQVPGFSFLGWLPDSPASNTLDSGSF